MSTVPANCVFTVRVFPSDFTISPVRRSPLVSVTWSAKSVKEERSRERRQKYRTARSINQPHNFFRISCYRLLLIGNKGKLDFHLCGAVRGSEIGRAHV